MDIESFLDAEGTWMFGCQVPCTFSFQTIQCGHTIKGVGSKANMKGRNWDWPNVRTPVRWMRPHFQRLTGTDTSRGNNGLPLPSYSLTERNPTHDWHVFSLWPSPWCSLGAGSCWWQQGVFSRKLFVFSILSQYWVISPFNIINILGSLASHIIHQWGNSNTLYPKSNWLTSLYFPPPFCPLYFYW